ncbi:sulfatase [uncultured Gimesia sp.]|jgi:N-sulfoglucosamine sulfohydrolase|uniref:sulfatase family protein n=1 Tax=uncultured Gimesia sp. TaxID=1678688 RepID=UPI002636FD10|nr:sulfatase [uncultured Gimesia sp.]
MFNGSVALRVLFCFILISKLVSAVETQAAEKQQRPNILFAIADDWGWPHAGAYGDPVVKTPTFDRLAREGVLFQHAYVSSPSCTPSRGAILTGKYHWQLEAGANLHCIFPDKFETYPEVLKEHGYQVGYTGKAWGPGRTETPARELAGKRYKNFQEFLDHQDKSAPFCFWLGSSDPHRPYAAGSGVKSGMDLSKIKLPACFPDAPEVRSDVADYYWEVQRFDQLVGDALALLEKQGELENTIVFMTGDHGMPFPRGKSCLYDTGTRVPLAARWPAKISAGRSVTDFVSLIDLAPTFYEAAGIAIPADVTGRSLLPILSDSKSGRVTADRGEIYFGKERHVPSQEIPDMGGYPCRAIRTDDFLYIHNYRPDRWPAGTPDYQKAAIPGTWYGDCDNGPTKTYMIENKDKDANHRRLYELAFGKLPAEELYDLRNDADQLTNVAAEAMYQTIKTELAKKLHQQLIATHDPRELGQGAELEKHPYLGGGPKHPSLEVKQKKRAQQKQTK